MEKQSLVDIYLNCLGLLPSNKKNQKLKDFLQGISTSRLASKLTKQRFRASTDPLKLIKHVVDIDIPLVQPHTLWDKLRLCGSGICESMFTGIPIRGNYISNHKLLPDTYSEKFLGLFEYLWKRDKALCKLEWKMMGIGRLNSRNHLLYSLSNEIIDYILGDNPKLTQVMAMAMEISELQVHSLGLSLVYKAIIDPGISDELSKDIEIWFQLDPTHASLTLARSIDDTIEYDVDRLTERFETRIRSSKILTGKFNYRVNPKYIETDTESDPE
jgi:hypothetical protein